MSTDPKFLTAPHDPRDPNPWLATFLDRSIPISDECKKAWLADSSSRSRQFLLPIVRPLARTFIILFQLVRIVLPRSFASSTVLHWLLEWNMRRFVSRNANVLIFRHFHLGSEVLGFIARNTRGVQMSLTPLKPLKLEEIRDHVYVKHDLNLFNFVIDLNRQLREQGRELQPIDELDFSGITDGPLPFEEMPNRWSNFVDLETAIEIYTPVYQLFLTDNDFWRASNSLQFDETIGIYVAKLLNVPHLTGLVNNRHPMVPLATLRAGFRLVLHGLATESLHALLVEHKRKQIAHTHAPPAGREATRQ
jgi:hypothetical protein